MVLLFRSAQALRAGNLFLRRQLALYIERGVPPHRVDAATRVRLVVLARLFDWRGALMVAQPATMIVASRRQRLLRRTKSATDSDGTARADPHHGPGEVP
jgi:hypothetical protein